MIERVRNRAVGFGVFLAALVIVALTVSDEHLEAIGTWVLVAMLLPANYFPIFYTIAFRWWDAHLGRALFTKALGLAVVLDTALMVKFFGGEEYATEVRFVAYALVLVGMYYQSAVMTAIRLSANRKDGTPGPQTDLDGVDLTDRHPERRTDSV
jgi:hypothetical protein